MLSFLENTILHYCENHLHITIEDSIEKDSDDIEFEIGEQVLIKFCCGLEGVYGVTSGQGHYDLPTETFPEGRPSVEYLEVFFNDEQMELSKEGSELISKAIESQIYLK